MFLLIAQIGMAVFGCPAFILLTRNEIRAQKIGCVLGLMGSPFWWLMVFQTKQYYTIPVHVLYTYGWLQKTYFLFFFENNSNNK